MGPTAALLQGNRLHLQHGPIDLIIGADGDRAGAFAAAEKRFATVLSELMEELPLLRQLVGQRPKGHIALSMFNAALPHADGITTPMICVAGAVAEEVLASMVNTAELTRAYVNNGGDIALHLTDEATFRAAIASPSGQSLGTAVITSDNPIRGIATSGQHGRSLSLGIADSATVLAPTAAMADAAATKIANAVDLPDHPAIRRFPANELRDDSDLGDTPVVIHVGALSATEITTALDAGHAKATTLYNENLIHSAALFLQDQASIIGQPILIPAQPKELAHA